MLRLHRHEFIKAAVLNQLYGCVCFTTPCSETNKPGGSESKEKIRIWSLLRDVSEQHVVVFYGCWGETRWSKERKMTESE